MTESVGLTCCYSLARWSFVQQSGIARVLRVLHPSHVIEQPNMENSVFLLPQDTVRRILKRQWAAVRANRMAS